MSLHVYNYMEYLSSDYAKSIFLIQEKQHNSQDYIVLSSLRHYLHTGSLLDSCLVCIYHWLKFWTLITSLNDWYNVSQHYLFVQIHITSEWVSLFQVGDQQLVDHLNSLYENQAHQLSSLALLVTNVALMHISLKITLFQQVT